MRRSGFLSSKLKLGSSFDRISEQQDATVASYSSVFEAWCMDCQHYRTCWARRCGLAPAFRPKGPAPALCACVCACLCVCMGVGKAERTSPRAMCVCVCKCVCRCVHVCVCVQVCVCACVWVRPKGSGTAPSRLQFELLCCIRSLLTLS